MSKTMSTQRERRIAASINGCQIIRNKKARVLESLNTINNIIETERLIKELSEETNNARELVRECDKKYSEMAPQIDVKRQYHKLITGEVNHLEEELIPLEEEVKTFEAKIVRQETLLSEKKQIISQITEFENAIAVSQEKIERYTPLVGSLKEEVPSLKSSISTVAQELTKAEGDIQKLSRETETLSERLAVAGDATIIQKSLNRVRENSNTIKIKIKGHTASLEKNSTEKERCNASIVETKNLLTNKREEIDYLKKGLESLKQAEIPGEDVPSLEKSAQEAQQNITETEREIEKITAELEEHLKHKGGIIEEMDKAQVSLANAQQEYEVIEEQVTPYEEHPEKLETVQKNKTALKQTCLEYKEKMVTIDEELRHLVKASDLMQVEHSEYAEAMEEIEKLLG